jgi:fructose 1,6-bisphosphate aldolase/phosphatase
MNMTISLIKADEGPIGGHAKPSDRMMSAVKSALLTRGYGLLINSFVSRAGDDIALLMSHQHGKGNEKVRYFAWHTFLDAADIARQEGLYRAGQDGSAC